MDMIVAMDMEFTKAQANRSDVVRLPTSPIASTAQVVDHFSDSCAMDMIAAMDMGFDNFEFTMAQADHSDVTRLQTPLASAAQTSLACAAQTSLASAAHAAQVVDLFSDTCSKNMIAAMDTMVQAWSISPTPVQESFIRSMHPDNFELTIAQADRHDVTSLPTSPIASTAQVFDHGSRNINKQGLGIPTPSVITPRSQLHSPPDSNLRAQEVSPPLVFSAGQRYYCDHPICMESGKSYEYPRGLAEHKKKKHKVKRKNRQSYMSARMSWRLPLAPKDPNIVGVASQTRNPFEDVSQSSGYSELFPEWTQSVANQQALRDKPGSLTSYERQKIQAILLAPGPLSSSAARLLEKAELEADKRFMDREGALLLPAKIALLPKTIALPKARRRERGHPYTWETWEYYIPGGRDYVPTGAERRGPRLTAPATRDDGGGEMHVKENVIAGARHDVPFQGDELAQVVEILPLGGNKLPLATDPGVLRPTSAPRKRLADGYEYVEILHADGSRSSKRRRQANPLTQAGDVLPSAGIALPRSTFTPPPAERRHQPENFGNEYKTSQEGHQTVQV